jgi:hypothetical protein
LIGRAAELDGAVCVDADRNGAGDATDLRFCVGRRLSVDGAAAKERHVPSPNKVSPAEEDIKARAYAMWEEEGRPEGKHLEHWSRAAREVGDPPAPAETPKPAPKRNDSGKI